MPADCICRVISRNGDRTLFERLSTPRPAPKVTLKSNWHSQQQQQQQPLSGSVSSSSRKLNAVETENRDVKGNTTEDPGSSGFRKLERNSVSPVDKKPKFEIDLRLEGVPQDAILKDEEQLKEINQKLEKLKIGSCTKPIRNDLKKKGDNDLH